MYFKKDRTIDPEITLVFPPLVETNFGCYYPSTAVLAGFLATKNISVSQHDLNEQFAVYLLQSERLESMSKGNLSNGLC